MRQQSVQKVARERGALYQRGVRGVNEVNYDLSTARKNPYAERLKKGYTIRIHVPPEEERQKEMNDFLITDEELQTLKEFVASEEQKRSAYKM